MSKSIVLSKELNIGLPYVYTRFMKLLGLTVYSDPIKKNKQLEKIKSYIDYEVRGNKYIFLGMKEDIEFIGLEEYYNSNSHLDKNNKLEIKDILKFVLMNYFREKLYDVNKDNIYITTYDKLSRELGFVNDLFYISHYDYFKLAKVLKIKGNDVKRVINDIRSSYIGYIDRGLSFLEKNGYLIIESKLWGWKEEFSSKEGGEKNNKTIETFESWVSLSKEEEEYFNDVATQEAIVKCGCFNMNEIKRKGKEKEYFRAIDEIMFKVYGLSHIGRRLEIKLGEKSDDVFFKKLKKLTREREWINKQFFEKMKDNKIKLLEAKNIKDKEVLKRYIFLLEILIKKIRSGARQEIRNAHNLIFNAFTTESGRLLEFNKNTYKFKFSNFIEDEFNGSKGWYTVYGKN